MAKNSNYDFNDWDDFEDFSQFDDGDGQGGFKSTTKKGKAREAVGALSGGFVTGVKKSLFTRNFYQNLTGAALPKEYSVALDKTLDVADNIGYLYDTAQRESETFNDKLTKGVKPIVDKYGDKLPKRMARPLRKWTSNVRSSNQWTRENKDELESVAALNDIFNTREQTRSIKNTSVQTQVQTGIAQNSMNLTARMLEQQSQLVAYQDQIDSAWKRKTLELQYKQFFVQRKTLDVQQQLLGLSKVSFEAIVKHTALPDLVKARGTEVAGRMMTEKLYGAALNQFSGLPYNIVRQLTDNVAKKMKSGSRNLQSSVMDKLNNAVSASQQGGMGGPLDNAREGGGAAGEIGGGILGQFIGKQIKKRYGENANVKHGADVLGASAKRLPRAFNDMVRSGDSGNSFIDMILELTDAKNTLSPGKGTIMKRHDDQLEEQVYFDLLTKKSITEIIPGYLTRIHHEIRSLRTGDDTASMLAYDFEKGRFSDNAKITKRLKDKTIGSYNRQAMAGVHDELSEALGINELSEELRHQMLKQFSLASINNQDFTFRSMFDKRESKLDDDQKDELSEFLLDKYGIVIEDQDLNAGVLNRMRTGVDNQYNDSSQAAAAQKKISDSLNKLQGYLTNPAAAMNKSARVGQLENAIELGIVEENNGTYTINHEKFIEALMNGDLGESDSSGDFKPPGEEEKSKTRIYADEKRKQIADRSREIRDRIIGNPSSDDSEREDDDNPDSTGLKERTQNAISSASNKVSTVSSKAMSDFKSAFTTERLNELKSKYSLSDKIRTAMDFVKSKTGRPDPTTSDVVRIYADYQEFRDMVKEIEEEEKAASTDESSPNGNALISGMKRIASNRPNLGNSVSTLTTSVADKVKSTVSKAQATGGGNKATEEDYAVAEDYADDFIEKNGLTDDDKGELKQSLIRGWFKDKFGDIKEYEGLVKTRKVASGAVARGKQGIDTVRSKGASAASGDAISLLFELGKYAAKAGGIFAKPYIGALKLIPWGVKKLVGLAIDTVNFKHIQHALWIEGEKEPRLLKTGLLNGRYINAEGDTIEKPTDIKGDIFDAMTTPETLIMTAAEYKGGLFDSTGKLIYKPPTLIGRITSGLVKLPFKLAKKAAKVAGKLFIGYLKITTKPATWIINKILNEKRIDPKLHAELVQLGLTDQTNQKLDNIGQLIDDRIPKKEDKHNDKDGDGHRDGSAADVKSKRDKKKSEEIEKREKKRGLFGSKKKKKGKEGEDGEEDEEGGFDVFDMLGKGKMMGKIGRLAANPYVIGGIAIASLLGWEFATDGSKNKDPEDIANIALPDGIKDNKAARIGMRISEKIVDHIVLAPLKNSAKALVKMGDWVLRGAAWADRKLGKMSDGFKGLLAAVPGKVTGFLFGKKAEGFVNKLMQIDNVNPLFRFRMAQYGFKHNDKTSVESLLKFEADLLETLTPATDTAPARLSDSITIEQSAAYFGVSINDEKDLTEWIAWYANRFRPVFLSNVTVLERLGTPGKQLHEVDSTLSKAEKIEFLDKIHFHRADNNPYDVNVSPLATEWYLSFGDRGDVDKVRKDQLAEIMAMSDDKKVVEASQARTAKREQKLVKNAKNKHETTEASKYFDPYAAIDKLTFKNVMKVNVATINKIKGKEELEPEAVGEGGTFGGAGAGGTTAATVGAATGAVPATGATPTAAAKPASISERGGIFGAAASGIGGLFMNQAHASTFIPEMEYGGAKAPMGLGSTGMTASNAVNAATGDTQLKRTVTALAASQAAFKPNGPDGTSSMGPNDKPMAAARFARKNAKADPSGNATKYIKDALSRAGYSFKAPSAASEYPAKALPDMGFSKIDNGSPWVVGDIIVFTSTKDYPNGHIQIYDGANWISDHIQQNWIPFPSNAPSHTIWRDVQFASTSSLTPGKDAKSGFESVADGQLIKTDSTGKAIETKSSANTKEETKGVIAKALDSLKAASVGTWDTVKEKASNTWDSVKETASNAGGFFSNTLAAMTGTQKEWQLKVYQAFKNAGFAEMHARILTAEIGRENSYNPKYLFAGHADPHKGSNLGMLSWQGDRKPRLVAHLQKAGVLDKNNNMVPGQESLDAQAAFIMWEMNNSHKGVGKQFLANPNISYADGAYMIGKRYILWRIDDPKYASKGAKNRDGFYNMLIKQLGDGATVSTKDTVAAATSSSARNGVTAASLAANTMGPVKSKAQTPQEAAANQPKTTGKEQTPAAADKTLATYQAAVVKSETDPVPKEKGDSTSTSKTALPPNAAPVVAAKYIRRNAAGGSKGLCAKYVRLGLQHAGYKFTPQASAYMYATKGIMSAMGMGQIATNTPLQIGDVIIIGNSPAHKHGHICIWDGGVWVSDFVQKSWNVYRGAQQYTMWRDRRYLNGASASSGPSSSAAGGGANNSSGASGTYGSSGGSGAAAAPYVALKMKYNDYTGFDAKIKESFKTGSGVLKPNAAEAVQQGTTAPAKSSVVDKKVVDDKAKEVKAATVAASSSFAPDLKYGNSYKPVDPTSSSKATVEKAAKVQEQTVKSLTQKMADVETRKSNDDLASSSQTLLESLKVQKQMLDRLISMDSHLMNVVKGQAQRQITDSSNVADSASSATAPKQQSSNANHKVKRPGRDEPMSMAKML